jgi:hypothetical protein
MLMKINGRLKFFSRVQEVRKLRPGHYVAQSSSGVFHIEGGRPAGGTSREWFVEAADGSNVFGGKHLNATSLMDALNLLENM